MVVPANYGPDEQFQDAVKRVMNKLVKERFKDVDLDEGDVDLSSARGALKTACLHLDKDSMPLTVGRLLLFTQVCGFGLEQVWDLFGGEVERHVASLTYLPQVKLFFRESEFDSDPGFLRLTAVVSFRISGEDSDSFTKAKAEVLANKISSQFAKPTPYKFKKGKELFTYKDYLKGYNLKIYAFNETEAKRVFRDALSINGDTLKDELVIKNSSISPSEAYPTLPPKKRIIGELTQQPRKRPVGNVSFRYAQLNLMGRIKPLTLVDTTYSFPNALVRI